MFEKEKEKYKDNPFVMAMLRRLESGKDAHLMPPKIIDGFEMAACCIRDRYTREIPCLGTVEHCEPRRAYLRWRERQRERGFERERTLER